MRVNSKLKILAIIPTGFCFGLQHMTVDFFSSFPKCVESHFLLTRWNNGEMEKLLRAKNLDYSFSWLGMFSRKLDWPNLRMSLHALIKLPVLYYDYFRIIHKFKPDILYFANHHELLILYPVLFFSKQRIVCHMHDPAPAIPFQKRSFRLYGKRVSHFIAISESVRKRTIELGCDPRKISTIYNGVQVPDSPRKMRGQEICLQNNWPMNVFIVGITGQMTATKGYDDLYEAFKILYQQNDKARLVFGGKLLEPLYTSLKEKIREDGMTEFVTFTGWLNYSHLFFRNIDVFVLASKHDEGFGLVVAEAMALGIPVVVTKSGGVVELIEDGISGFVVEKRDVNRMAEKLLILSNDSASCLQMGRLAHVRVLSDFNLKTQADKLAKFLINLI